MAIERIAFGPFAFDRTSATLWREGTLLPVGGRGAALLGALLEAAGDVATKSVLIEAGWPGVIVEESNLGVQIGNLRKILGARPDGGDWIETVPRVGYRLPREAAAAEALRPAAKPSIAVLPFDNLGGGPEQEGFVDGLVEDLITALSRFKTFAVVARNSAFVYKGRAVDVRDVARELGVHYVLVGSVRRGGSLVRVGAQLVDGETGSHLWADTFDGRLEDVFDFEDIITESVIGLIEPQIRKAEIERARRKRPENLDAYDLYLRALPLVQGEREVRPEAYDQAIVLLEKAIGLDPGFAPALVQAAWAHEMRLTRGWPAPPGVDDAATAVVLAERALAADNDDAIVLVLAGMILVTVKNNETRGLGLVRRALALNPNSLLVANAAGYAHFYCGNADEAIACHLRGLAFSVGLPDAFWSLNAIARAHLSLGRIEEALTWGLRGLAASDRIDMPHCVVAAAYAHMGQLDEARAVIANARAIWPALTIASLLGRTGDPAGRDRVLAEGLALAELPAP